MAPARFESVVPARALVLSILALTAVSFQPAVKAPFTFDETAGIQENRAIHEGASVLSALRYRYSPDQARPLFFLSLWADARLFGLSPGPFRLTNLFLHLLCGVAVYLLLRRLTGLGTAGPSAGPALLGLALFLLHPLQSESVIYIWGRSEILSTLLLLLSLGLASYALGPAGPVRPREPGSPWSGPPKRLMAWSGSLASLELALAAKEEAIILPVVAFIWWAIAEARPPRRAAIGAAWLCLPVVLFLALRPVALGAMGRQVYVRSVGQNLLGQAIVTLRMLRLLVLPFGQTVDPVAEVPGPALGLLGIAVCVGLFVGAALLPRLFPGSGGARSVSAGILIFFASCALYWAVPLPDLMSERRAYLPMFGAALSIAGGLMWIAERRDPAREAGASRWDRLALLLPAGALTLLLFPAMAARARVWSDPRRLWLEAARLAPTKARPLINLGVLAAERGERDKAADFLDRALALEPENGEARFNRARLRLDANDARGALADLESAVMTNPGMVRAWINLGLAKLRLGDRTSAESALRSALKIDPGDPRALTNLAEVLRASGRTAEALPLYSEALDSDPAYAHAAARLGVALEALGDRRGALAAYREYLARVPGPSADRDAVLEKVAALEGTPPGGAAAPVPSPFQTPQVPP